MSALKDDLAAGGKFRVIVPACRPDPCSRSTGSELLKTAHAAGADFLLVGGIHKMSTLVQWAKAEVIDRQERPDRARQTFHLPRGHRSGVEARRRVHIKRTCVLHALTFVQPPKEPDPPTVGGHDPRLSPSGQGVPPKGSRPRQPACSTEEQSKKFRLMEWGPSCIGYFAADVGYGSIATEARCQRYVR